MEPQQGASSSVTYESFGQREGHRRSQFSRIWSHLVPEVFKDVPTYYRSGNIVASLGLWELWVWQFIRTIKLRPHDKALDVCAGTNDVGVRLLQQCPAVVGSPGS